MNKYPSLLSLFSLMYYSKEEQMLKKQPSRLMYLLATEYGLFFLELTGTFQFTNHYLTIDCTLVIFFIPLVEFLSMYNVLQII